MGGETELTATTAVMWQLHFLSMAVAVNGCSGDGVVTATIDKDMTTMQWWRR